MELLIPGYNANLDIEFAEKLEFSRKPGGSGFTSGGVQGSTPPDVHTPYGGFEKVQKILFFDFSVSSIA